LEWKVRREFPAAMTDFIEFTGVGPR
jgi:hypothetical protein